MKLLLVGALSWNPERFRALAEQGHELYGLWSRSMPWDEGPYPVLDGCLRPVALEDAARTIRDEGIDCVYSLFQVYDPRLWGPLRPGVEHDVWTILRRLLRERARGAFDAPIVRHWGFDVHVLEPDVVRALDGHIFCNPQKLEYFTAPRSDGGCGIDAFGSCRVVAFLDSDRPKLEFMHERFASPLSVRRGEIHTVCVGRPFNVDFVAAARRGIHVHVYGNGFDETARTLVRGLGPEAARATRELLGTYVHIHDSLQTIGATWEETRAVKARWVEEFSQYDAGWSYIGLPFPWEPLDDRAAIPNRLGTYLLAGLPVIADRRPGAWRYEELRRLGALIELEGGDYDALRARLDDEVATRSTRDTVRQRRVEYAFEATAGPLLETLEQARSSYFATPYPERTRFDSSRRPSRVDLYSTSGLGAPTIRKRASALARRLIGRGRALVSRERGSRR